MTTAVAIAGSSRLLAVWRWVNANRLAAFGIAVVVIMAILAIIGPWIVPYDPEMANGSAILRPPSSEYWFGTDSSGMDVFSRTLAAPRTDILIAVTASGLALLIGVPLGAAIGYFADRSGPKGVAADGLVRAMDVLQAFPVFILALALVAMRGPSATNVIFAIAFVNAPVFLRLARAEVMSWRQRTFVEAARCSGTPESQIIFGHLLRNGVGPVLTQFSVTVGFAILLTAGLSFLGAGVRAPTPEWGVMISEGARLMTTGQWWVSVFPGIFLALTVFGLALAGEVLRTRLDRIGARRQPSGASVAVTAPQLSAEEVGEPDPVDADVAVSVQRLRVEVPGTDRTLLDIDRLDVRRAEPLAIVGGGGSGKSLLALALANAVPRPAAVTSGRVLFMGENLLLKDEAEMREIRGDALTIVLSEARQQLNPLEKIGKQIANVIRGHDADVSKGDAHERAIELLRMVSIPDPARTCDRYPHELSGGMAQRVLVAIGLSGSPQLIVSDEATYGLDVTIQRQIMDLMAAIVAERRIGWIVITRDLGIVAQYCDHVVVLKNGRIDESQSVTGFFAEPTSEYGRRIVETAGADQHVGATSANGALRHRVVER